VPEEGDTPLVLAAGRLYLRRYWRCERQVAAAIGSRLRRSPPPPDNLAELLETLFAGSADIPEWPRIACALAARGSFTVVTGGPGTGKTTTVVKLVALLQAGAGRERPLRVRLAAPTGKAAARLTESIGKAIDQVPETLRAGIPREAVTLHKLLGARPGTRRLRYGAGHPLHADLVVVDEASMIDLEMMAALLAALRPETRLVLLGDKDQLASVEAGAVLADLCAGAEVAGYDGATAAWLEAVAGQHPEVAEEPRGGLRQQLATLRISRRYGEDSGIGRLARAVNAGDAAAAAEIWRGPYPDLLRIDLEAMADDGFAEFLVEGWAPRQPGGQEGGAGYRAYLHTLESGRPQAGAAAARFDEWAGEVLDAFDGFRVLCATRRGDCGVDGLNQRIAETLLRRRLISQAHGWYEGRPVMLAHNDYGLGLMNGDIGIALQVPVAGGEYRLRACFRLPDGRIKQVLPSRLGDCETVYAMTVHKSQGSEFGHVALVLPDSRNPILTRELVYTGITRAKRRFSLVARDFAVLDWALERRVRRSGGLAELLKNV
jgi:exodeoxyribonuclease V alpha subunit